MKRLMRLAPALAITLAIAGAPALAAEESPFSEADIFFELNDTDGDLGFHALIDGEPWRELTIEDPQGKEMLNVSLSGRLLRQGLTELFFESAEPSFDELPPERFFRRFPEGEYEIAGKRLGRHELESTDELSHVMPAPPGDVRLSGQASAENCDAIPLPVVDKPVLITWAPVTGSHPEIGTPGVAIEVDRYQVVIEKEDVELSVLLPPDVTEFEVPDELIEAGDEVKFEILVREESGNQTAVESCFIVG